MLLTTCMDPPADTASEDRLLERWSAGDRDALEALLGALYAPARAVARRLAGEALADDAVWAGFARVASQARSCRGPVRPWALAVVANMARNLSRDDRRRRARDGVAAATASPPAAVAPDASVERHERTTAVRTALANLPEHERVPVCLVYLDGLDAAEAAAVLGRSASTVRSQIQRGLGRLRGVLGGSGAAIGGLVVPGLVAETADLPTDVPAARISDFARSAPAAAAPAGIGVLAAMTVAGILAAGAAWVMTGPAAGGAAITPSAADAHGGQPPPPPPIVDIGVPADDGGPLSAGGLFGSRRPPFHDRAVARLGGTIGSEAAVRNGLGWLSGRQRPDGSWTAEAAVGDAMQTSQVLLSFLGAGVDPEASTVSRGIAWLMAQSDPDDPAACGARLMALAEHYAMTTAPAGTEAAYRRQVLQGQIQAGIDRLLDQQSAAHDAGGRLVRRGWGARGGDVDLAATLWCMLGLKSAFAAGFSIGDGLAGTKEHLAVAWRAANDGQGGRPDWRQASPEAATVMSERCAGDATSYVPGFGRLDQAPAGLLMAAMLGSAHAGSPMYLSLAAAPPPDLDGGVTQAAVWQGAGLFQSDGVRWTGFNHAVRDRLVVLQRRDGDLAGSWDGPGDGGRTLATALGCQALSVYVRWVRMYQPAPQPQTRVPLPLKPSPPPSAGPAPSAPSRPTGF